MLKKIIIYALVAGAATISLGGVASAAGDPKSPLCQYQKERYGGIVADEEADLNAKANAFQAINSACGTALGIGSS